MSSQFRVAIGADPGGVEMVMATFTSFAEEHAVPDTVRRSINVALDELLANSLAYGLTGEGSEVVVDVELQRDRLIVTVSDDGTPFDPFGRSAPDTTMSVEDRPIGGLGIHLVRKLVDDVSYERRDGRNVVVLTKRLVQGTSAQHRGGSTMEITKREHGDAWIIAIAGNLDSVTSPKAQKELEAILSSGGRKLAVDFSSLDYISSAGLRVLLGVAKQLGAKGGALRTYGLNQTVKEVFDISGFSAILPVYPSEAEALNGF
jgi:anti-anti-sigma factor